MTTLMSNKTFKPLSFQIFEVYYFWVFFIYLFTAFNSHKLSEMLYFVDLITKTFISISVHFLKGYILPLVKYSVMAALLQNLASSNEFTSWASPWKLVSTHLLNNQDFILKSPNHLNYTNLLLIVPSTAWIIMNTKPDIYLPNLVSISAALLCVYLFNIGLYIHKL